MVTMTAIVVPLVSLLWLNHDAVRAFIDFVRGRQAVVDYLDQLGFIGPLVLMGLVGLQVLIPSLPAEPPMIAGAYAYGFTAGFLMSWLVSVAASQAVFYLARYAGRPVVEHIVPAKVLDKWTRTAGEKGMAFFLLAFVIPPVPSDILIYMAGLSAIEGRRFFVTNLFGRMPMIVLLTLVGAIGFRITPAMIVGLTVISILMLVAWLYFVRQRPDAEINVAQARLALESAQRGLENVELIAPASGTVTAINAAPGALVGGGSPIVTLLDTTQLEFHTTNLSERDLAQVLPGQTAVVTLKAYPNKPIEAVVVRIGLQTGVAVGDAATFPVVLALSETDLDIRPGMTGRAEIRIEE